MSLRLDCKGGHAEGEHRRECWAHTKDAFVQVSVSMVGAIVIFAAVDSAGVAWWSEGFDGRWRQLRPHPSTLHDEHGDLLPEGGGR